MNIAGQGSHGISALRQVMAARRGSPYRQCMRDGLVCALDYCELVDQSAPGRGPERAQEVLDCFREGNLARWRWYNRGYQRGIALYRKAYQ